MKAVPMIRTLSKVRHLVKAFESGSLLPHEWNDRTLLILGLWHVLNPSHDGAEAAMRRGVIACEAKFDGSGRCFLGLSDPVTAAYLEEIRAFAVAAPASLGLLDLANALVKSREVGEKSPGANAARNRGSSVRVRRRQMQPRLTVRRMPTGSFAVAAH